MKTYLVTGAAGFIGANYIKYILAKHEDIRVVVLDALTYAGNLGTIAKDIDDDRCYFIKGNICDRNLADQLFSEYKFDYIINFAAESHVDRSIENPQLFLQTNILGTQNLRGGAMYVSIRCPPMKYMVHWEMKASLPKIPHYVRTARIVHQKPVQTSSSLPIVTLTKCL